MEKEIVILDRRDFNENKRYIRDPSITTVISYGNGWLDVKMSDGFYYRRMGGTLSWRYNNPGNIKYGQFSRMQKSIGKGWGGHAVFPTYEIGRRAKQQLLFTPIRRYYNLSIREALTYYAPVNDRRSSNRPDIYARYIVRHVPGVTLGTKLRNMNQTQQLAMLNAMERFEGYKTGKVHRL